jgi:hypothetical protein
MINDYLGGELALSLLGGVFEFERFCSFCFGFELILALVCHFAWFAAFRSFCWPCGFSFF